MQESYSIEERYRDLVERAERYFRVLERRGHLQPGMLRWLHDAVKTRDMEAIESWQTWQEFGREQIYGRERDDIIDVD